MIVCDTVPTLYPLMRGLRSVVSRLGSKWSEARSDPALALDLRSRETVGRELPTIGRVKVRSQPGSSTSQRKLLLG
ncbi:uncharacterized protein PG998_015082 [Apiospora kogelbergensis]|uniref:Uncharacterized protein n=1 Tax=Apiospora kogelbergensis TaxID=1337665 RepID=A0AAW0R5Q5_9PEZI